MNSDDSKQPLFWMGTGLVAILAAIMWLGSSMRGFVTSKKDDPNRYSGPSKLSGGTELGDKAEEEEEAPDTPSVVRHQLTPEELDEQLLAMMEKKLQGVGAMEKEAILTFKNKEELEAFLKRAGLYGVDIMRRIGDTNSVGVKYTSLDKLRDEFKEHSDAYESLSANYMMRVPGLPEPDANNQGGTAPFGPTDALASIGATGTVQDRMAWGQGVTVAVLDTGITAHKTFAEGQIAQHIDLVNDGKAFHGHGTAMASLIAGRSEEAAGVAPGATLIDIRVADADGITDTSTMADAIYKAIELKANVITMSLGGYGDAPAFKEAISTAISKGIAVTAASGNEQLSQLAYPAAYDGVLSVGSYDANHQQSWFSNAGDDLDLSAPGVNIRSAWSDNKLVDGDGTSQSNALAAGVLAAYSSFGLTPIQAVNQTMGSAYPVPLNQQSQLGTGMLWVSPLK